MRDQNKKTGYGLLKKAGLPRSQYNQIANYACTQEEINIKIGKKPHQPMTYFADV